MHLATVFVVATVMILLFTFVLNNLNYVFDVLELDVIKLKQSYDFAETRNKSLTDIDLANLEIN